MKLRIGSKTYDAVGHRTANLLHLIELREHTRRLLEEPLGMSRLDELEATAKRIRRELKAARAAGDAAAVKRLEAEQADDGLLWTAILVFLTRRKAGERLTFAEAVSVDLEEFEWIEEDGDRAVPPDGDRDEDDDEDDPAAAPDPTSPGSGSPATGGSSREPRDVAPGKGKRKRRGGRSTTSERP